jgi:hypothetical protein
MKYNFCILTSSIEEIIRSLKLALISNFILMAEILGYDTDFVVISC